MQTMQTIFPFFTVIVVIVTVWVALIWAIVIAVTIRNVFVAVKNRGKNDKDKDGGSMTDTIPSITFTTPSITTPDAMTIGGMPAGAYYTTQNTTY